jgi:hypothetical protein
MADSREEERQQEFAEQNTTPTAETAAIEQQSTIDIDPPSVRAYLTAKYAPPIEETFAGYEDTSAIDKPEVPIDPTAQPDPSTTTRKSASKNILSRFLQPSWPIPLEFTTRREVTSTLPAIQSSRPKRDSRQPDFRIWRLRRPFWGSILMMMASLMMLWGPVSLLRFALLPGSSIWAGIFVGVLLFIMALIQLLVPSYAVITGGVGVALSLVSLIVAGFGGLGIGAILGTIGSALGVAWRPNAQPLPTRQR